MHNFEKIFLLNVVWFIGTNCWSIDIFYPENEIGNEINSLRSDGDERITLIFPGTKWCGSGNISESYDDLGYFAQTDACCRDHDHCFDVIEGKESKYNLTNPSFYSRLHCSCDERFYDCLHSSEDRIANKIGFFYFSLLDTKCFREDYPIVSCKTPAVKTEVDRQQRRCKEYELDESQPKIYQWFDVPFYKK